MIKVKSLSDEPKSGQISGLGVVCPAAYNILVLTPLLRSGGDLTVTFTVGVGAAVPDELGRLDMPGMMAGELEALVLEICLESESELVLMFLSMT